MTFNIDASALLRIGTTVVLVALAVACSSGGDRPRPDDLPALVGAHSVRQVWKSQLPPASFPIRIDAQADTVTLAGADGTVVAIDAESGAERWRARIGGPLQSGVGSDGTLSAVITTKNELVVLQDGKVLWSQHLTAEGFTAPLVAGHRVFVLTADRTVSAWDGASGRRLWSQSRTAENLVLKQPGVLLAMGNTLIAGLGGRLVGLSPADGSVRWEAPVAAPRGTNDVEKLVDLTGAVSRVGDVICARAYRAAVGCVDASHGTLLWSRPASGAQGVGGDGAQVYGTELNGDVVAWRRDNGERAWVSQRLRNRELTAPLATDHLLVMGESTGALHFMGIDDGALRDRVVPDGSAITTAPVLAGNTIVVTTRHGGVFGYRPG
jgi:outer membrane protein assembly factor BamB